MTLEPGRSAGLKNTSAGVAVSNKVQGPFSQAVRGCPLRGGLFSHPSWKNSLLEGSVSGDKSHLIMVYKSFNVVLNYSLPVFC